jgi:hypothetical protein
MAILKKVKVFFSLDFKSMLIIVEALFYLGWARLLINRPFSKISPTLGIKMQESPDRVIKENISALKNVYQAINIMSRHTFWESKCLVKAIAGMKMLERRKIDSTLYLGTARDERNGRLIAHAWLRSGPFYITGKDGMEKFTIVERFAKNTSGGIRGEKNER